MILGNNNRAAGCKNMLGIFNANEKVVCSEILKFDGIGHMDVYNPSVPFVMNGETIIAGRVEMRDSEEAKTIFFIEKDNIWVPHPNAPIFDLQDPFVTQIGDELVFGGVRVIWEGKRIVSWVTDFLKGKSIDRLEHFAEGPSHMKDIRLIELPDGRIGIFTRPQGKAMIEKFGCIAKIGFTTVDSLSGVSPEVICDAPLLEGHFLKDEWGGCNQLHVLKNGLIGAVAHIACREGSGTGEILHYYGMAFAFDPRSGNMSRCKIISTRSCFPEGPSKQKRLKDVTFTSGVIRNGNGTATLYSGLSDCRCGKAIITDPFIEYEEI